MVVKSKLNKPGIFLIFLVFVLNNSLAQTNYFSGVFTINDSLAIPYYLSFSSDLSEAYSVTDMFGNSETLTTVEVASEYSSTNVFKETEIVYTKIKSESYDEFCKLNFRNSNKNNIRADYTATLDDGTFCGKGEIELIRVTKLKNRISNTIDKISSNKLVKISTSDDQRNETVNKLKDLTKYAIEDYASNINLLTNDFLDFQILKNFNKINIYFSEDLREKSNSIEVINSSFNLIGNQLFLNRKQNKKIYLKIKKLSGLSFRIKQLKLANMVFKITGDEIEIAL